MVLGLCGLVLVDTDRCFEEAVDFAEMELVEGNFRLEGEELGMQEALVLRWPLSLDDEAAEPDLLAGEEEVAEV